MHRLIRLACLLSMPLCSCVTDSVYAGPIAVDVKFDAVDSSLRGLSVGYAGELESNQRWIGLVEVTHVTDDSEELAITTVSTGTRYNFVRSESVELGPRFDLGLGSADLDRFRNRNELITLGIAVAAELRLLTHVSLYAQAGYRGYFDVTDPTTCRDGSTSKSTGQGTCSHHGGIAHANDQIGDSSGFELSVGMRVRF